MSEGREFGSTGQGKVKKLTKEHMSITHGYKQRCGEGQGRGYEASVEVGKGQGAGMRDICNSVNNEK